MSHSIQSKRSGGFDIFTIVAVWNKGKIAPPNDPNVYRQDICGNFILYSAYGDISHKYGWEIDHMQPVNAGGSDDLSNLQPLHCKANRAKSDRTDWFSR